MEFYSHRYQKTEYSSGCAVVAGRVSHFRVQPQPVCGLSAPEGYPARVLRLRSFSLANAGLVYSKKGKAGGYALAKPAGSISVGQIVRVLDGPLAPIQCSSVTAYRPCGDCGDEKSCAVRLIMVEARNALSAVLDSRSLAEMRGLPGRA